ncbi:MauE/DoxX family redox-associated membrane protein [Flavobacterium sp.]|uniref:heavy-metal-associated domain-containing protein n=1 Tax=Flavobacterium sp. TaxID=239 RepID=UPI0028BE93B9|nr:MauE/DoxX family redox-associated membrane protein [Flavobacterium sp.]
MTHTYQITGMTCSSCEAKVKSALFSVPDVTDVVVSKETNSAQITMDKHIALTTLQNVLSATDSKYSISALEHNETVEITKSFLETYIPVLLIFAFITGVTLLIQLQQNHFNFEVWMRHFMAGFFLVFSFFKLLNLKGFAESYMMYDIVAKKIPAWAYLYAFVELFLGIAYLIDFNPLVTNSVAFIVMTVSIIGVLQSVLNKKRIQCACLGAVFNLPMSTITIIEDALMILMSSYMLLHLL